MSAKLSTPLPDEELDELDQFLLSEPVSDEAMTLDTLDGYLTAIVVGPATLVPSQRLPGVWGESEDAAPVYESMEQAQHASLLASTFRRESPKPGRSDPCPCGSGKKFKKCCGAEPTQH